MVLKCFILPEKHFFFYSVPKCAEDLKIEENPINDEGQFQAQTSKHIHYYKHKSYSWDILINFV